MIDETRPVVRRCSLSENYADPLRTGVDDPLNVGAAESGAVIITPDLCEDEIRYLLDQTVVIPIPIHKRNLIVSPFIFRFDAIDLAHTTLVTLFGELGRDERMDDFFRLIERVLAATESQNIRTIMLARISGKRR